MSEYSDLDDAVEQQDGEDQIEAPQDDLHSHRRHLLRVAVIQGCLVPL